MDAVRIFTCHFFGRGEQLAGAQGWQRAGGSVTSQSCLAGGGGGGAGGDTAMRMDGQTDGRMDGEGVGMYAPLQRSFVAVPAGCTSRDES